MEINPNNLSKYGINGTSYGSLLQSVLQRAYKIANSTSRASKNVIAPFNAAPYQSQFIDPESYAKAAAAAKYDSQIGTLQKQLGRLPAQTAQNISDIKAYYDQLLSDHAKRSDAAANAYKSATGEVGDIGKGIIAALGGNADQASPIVGGAAENAASLLGGLGANLAGFNANMGDIFQLQRGQQALAEQRLGDQELADLNDQIAGLQNEKGDFYTSALNDAKSTRFDQQQTVDNLRNAVSQERFNELSTNRSNKMSELAGLANMILGGSLADAQLTQANLGNISTAQGINDQETVNAIHKKQLQGIGSNAGYVFDNVKPGDRATLAADLTKTLVKNGQLTKSPQAAREYVKDQLFKVMGIKPSASANQWISTIVSRIVTPNRVTLWRKAHGLPTGAARFAGTNTPYVNAGGVKPTPANKPPKNTNTAPYGSRPPSK